MRRWIIPLLFGLIVAAGAGYLTVLAAPRVLMAAAIQRVASNGGYNRMTHVPLATADARTIVRPSPDLAYSSCPFDVSAGPVLVELPPIDALYWSLSVFQSNTDAAFVRNNFQARGAPVRVAILAPGQAAPRGWMPVRVEGDRGIALVRVLVPDRAAFAPIDAARRRAICHAG